MTSPSEPLRLEHPEQLPDRRPLDKYRTPEWATGALIESFPKLGAELLIDPCAGDCRMPRQLMAAGRFVQCVTNDIEVIGSPRDVQYPSAYLSSENCGDC